MYYFDSARIFIHPTTLCGLSKTSAAEREEGFYPWAVKGKSSGVAKGTYGLDLLVDILCGVLSGSGYLNLLSPKTLEGRPLPFKVGHYFGALRINYFRQPEEFKKDMDGLILRLKNSAKDKSESLIHGEKEFESEEGYHREGTSLYH